MGATQTQTFEILMRMTGVEYDLSWWSMEVIFWVLAGVVEARKCCAQDFLRFTPCAKPPPMGPQGPHESNYVPPCYMELKKVNGDAQICILQNIQ